MVKKKDEWDMTNVTTKDIIKHIQQHVYNCHESPENGLNLWLDYMIEFFDISAYAHGQKSFVNHVREMNEKSSELCKATLKWMSLTSDKIEKDGWFDSLGTIYEEMYQSKGKASALGQFYTPQAVCDVMSRITVDKTLDNKKRTRVLDCACGSGRTLLAAFDKMHKGYFIGQDIDHMSVKMCALNMMIHNMEGMSARTDALLHPDTYDYAYVINEANHPFPCGCYSIRKVYMPEQKEERKEPVRVEKTEKVTQPVQLTFNFD